MTEQKQPEEQWSPGTEVVSMYNFRGNSKEDLPFRRGEILTIVKQTRDPVWYIARHPNGKEGLIPANYVHKRGEVKLHAMPWFHGKMSRSEAEEQLASKEEGLFLIRESANFPGDYTLCICSQDKVEHYHIIYNHNKLTIDEEVFFENLTQLVEHYRKDADGLCSRLKKPLEKKGKMEYSTYQKIFEETGWVIKENDIKLQELLGGGHFANVYKAEYLPTHTPVAAKVLKDNNKASHLFLVEASVMTSLRHPNLVSLIGLVTGGKAIQIITEFMAKGCLMDYLRSRGRAVITKEDQIKFASDTARGMAYLENKSIVHRDLATRNVLLNDDDVAKVSDFGLARPEFANQEGSHLPIKWTAPEALEKGNFTNKSDVWSFGILLWEIYTYGRVPYPRIPLADVIRRIKDGYRMDKPEDCPDDVYDIMLTVWDINPDKRPSFKSLSKKLDQMRGSKASTAL